MRNGPAVPLKNGTRRVALERERSNNRSVKRESDLRRSLVEEMRGLLGVPYDNGVPVQHGVVRPTAIDCSGAIRWVAFKVCGGDARLMPEGWYGMPSVENRRERDPDSR